MRILFFSPRDCWPVDTGARLRDFHLARELARREQVTYVGFNRSSDAQGVQRVKAGPEGELDCVLVPPPPRFAIKNMVRGFLGPQPISVLNYESVPMQEELRSLVHSQNFDAVQMEGVNLLEYLPILQSAPHPPALFADWHNIESELLERYAEGTSNPAKRIYAQRSAHLLDRLESAILRLAVAHTVCSEREQRRLSERAPAARIEVVGNGVDVSFYAGTAEAPGQNLVFVGSMDYHANVDAAEYFAKHISPLIPARKFFIVGARPKKEVLALGSMPGVVVTGTVPDIRPYYRDAFAVVVPLRIGSGTRLKILEAMAAGVPVISTRLGAEGLEAVAGVHFLEANEPQEFRTAVARLDDAAEWRRLSVAGLDLVRRRYDWPILGEALDGLYQEMLSARLKEKI
jgi:glycosyltransferase involved in cell wall biosynthesis